jgi:uncharacterized membrane protein YkgB
VRRQSKARGIQPLLEHSPLMSWLYSLMTVNGVTAGEGFSPSAASNFSSYC